MSFRCLWTGLSLVLCVAAQAQAGPIVIDQVSPDGIFFFEHGAFERQQKVVAGVSGTLVGIDVFPTIVGESVTFFVNVGSPWQVDAHDFQTTYTSTVSDTFEYIDVSSAGIVLAAGDVFVWGTVGISGSALHFKGSSPGAYAPGESWVDSIPDFARDMAFRTHMDTTVIPEPGTIVLFGLGAGVLAWKRWRRKHLPG